MGLRRSEGSARLFAGVTEESITALHVRSEDRSFDFLCGGGSVSVNGQQADAEIYLTLVDQISELPIDQTDAFIPDGVQWLLTLTVCADGEQHTARFYEGEGTGEVARIVAGSEDAPEYGQTGGWRVGTLMMTCEGTRIQDERGNEQPTDISPSAAGQP